ncbi:MAG: hypothetical protein H7256_14970 [Bdellovibrio sp.]|nr:hypothetical protein [Bdellovibrio sp.]
MVKLKFFSEKIFESLFVKFLSEQSKNRIEATILIIAIASFIIHLLIILFVDFGLINLGDSIHLFKNPISAIYTPFSFILVYEVYLLVYYLPKSITVYIGKQYEIVTLILIRRLFKDLGNLQLTSDWFSVKGDLVFTYDLIATLILFFLISVFYNLNPQKDYKGPQKLELSEGTSLFIRMKNWMATLLVPVLVGIAAYSLIEWIDRSFYQTVIPLDKVYRIDAIFFDQFFTILILADVLLLLISFLRTDRFSMVIRNSGFVVSTILIKISFGTEGLLTNVLVIVAVLFGVTILAIQKRYDQLGISS